MLGCLSPAPHARHEASTSWPRRAPRRGGCPRPQALPPSRPAEATTDTYTLAKRTHVVFLYVRGRSDHAWPSSWLRRIGAVVHGSHVARAEYLRTMVILSAIVGLFEVSTGSKVLAAAVRRLSHRQSNALCGSGESVATSQTVAQRPSHAIYGIRLHARTPPVRVPLPHDPIARSFGSRSVQCEYSLEPLWRACLPRCGSSIWW
jgi:hypothetical protein